MDVGRTKASYISFSTAQHMRTCACNSRPFSQLLLVIPRRRTACGLPFRSIIYLRPVASLIRPFVCALRYCTLARPPRRQRLLEPAIGPVPHSHYPALSRGASWAQWRSLDSNSNSNSNSNNVTLPRRDLRNYDKIPFVWKYFTAFIYYKYNDDCKSK